MVVHSASNKTYTIFSPIPSLPSSIHFSNVSTASNVDFQDLCSFLPLRAQGKSQSSHVQNKTETSHAPLCLSLNQYLQGNVCLFCLKWHIYHRAASAQLFIYHYLWYLDSLLKISTGTACSQNCWKARHVCLSLCLQRCICQSMVLCSLISSNSDRDHHPASAQPFTNHHLRYSNCLLNTSAGAVYFQNTRSQRHVCVVLRLQNAPFTRVCLCCLLLLESDKYRCSTLRVYRPFDHRRLEIFPKVLEEPLMFLFRRAQKNLLEQHILLFFCLQNPGIQNLMCALCLTHYENIYRCASLRAPFSVTNIPIYQPLV